MQACRNDRAAHDGRRFDRMAVLIEATSVPTDMVAEAASAHFATTAAPESCPQNASIAMTPVTSKEPMNQ